MTCGTQTALEGVLAAMCGIRVAAPPAQQSILLKVAQEKVTFLALFRSAQITTYKVMLCRLEGIILGQLLVYGRTTVPAGWHLEGSC